MGKTLRDLQVQHRLSGAALLGLTRRPGSPPTLAIDARPEAGDIPLAPGVAFHPFGPGVRVRGGVDDITGQEPDDEED